MHSAEIEHQMDLDSPAASPSAIAIVGLGARLPGAKNLAGFWDNLIHGVESIRRLTDQELLDAGVDAAMLGDSSYVKAASVLDGIELFDAFLFGFSPKDAAIMDPQHRVFLECAWEALEHAGWSADEFPGSIGVFAGSGMNSYLMFHLVPNQQLVSSAGLFLIKQTGNDKDVLATRVSYQLNLTGPSITIQTACSTSLVAVHVACQSLLNRECDMALAGGVTIEIPHKQGYLYREREILSRDGHCRAFDADSSGTVFGSGAGVVVLRRLADALADGDRIHAVIRGSAINNDGARKVGYLAPSVIGQAEVVAEALAVADVPAESISYVETHGTGTPVGDPIEIAALTQAFRQSTDARVFCGIGSLKTNLGHLDAAAGVAGLIKTVLALENKILPPSLHFDKPNPQIDFESSPFYVNNRATEWKSGATPRRAGVTSLGIGGTNAHVILEEAPASTRSGDSRPWQILTLSAKSPAALETVATNLADHLAQHPELNLPDAAFTGHRGRKALAHRCAVVCRTGDEAIRLLRVGGDSAQIFRGREAARPGVAFLFPGQGAQYPLMAHGVYQAERVFRAELDRCAELLRPHLGIDFRALLFPPASADLDEAGAALTETRIAQPALFAIEYALAKLWMSWGIRPVAMIGHSLGEFVAACISGVLSLDDALKAVAARGRLMQSAPHGSMLAVQAPEQDARVLASGEISLAAVNGPRQCVLSGPTETINELEKGLTAHGVLCQRLRTSHAFHSASMDGILGAFTEVMRDCKLLPPQIPYVSNLTGSWMQPAEATDPAYWARHLRQSVRFADGLAELLQASPAVLLEVGPARVLSGLAARHPAKTEGIKIVSSARNAQEVTDDMQLLVSALAQLWVAGAKVDWSGFHAGERRRRVELPTYPFERQRYWIDAPKRQTAASVDSSEVSYYCPVWKRTELPAASNECARWLIFLDSSGLGERVVEELERAGHTVVTVRSGDRFARTGKYGYSLQPSNRSDYDRLAEALTESSSLPDRILHLWTLTAPDQPRGLETLPSVQALGFYSLLFLGQAIGAHDLSHSMKLVVVSNDLQSVSGEPIHHPERAVLLGPCKVIPREFTSIRSRSVDVALSNAGDHVRAARQIIAEVGQAFSLQNELVAYRGEERWVQTVEPARIHPTRDGLRSHGVYLITGGTGGIGQVIAEYLARTVCARLVLVSRTVNTPTTEFSRRLEQMGSEVLLVRADVTDLAAMQRAITEARQRFGAIHGVIHAAGVLDDGLIQLKPREAADCVLAPKVQGTLILDAALAGTELDFLALFSSVSCYTAPVGQVDYVAANAFLDAFAASNQAPGKPRTVAINWGRWGETGMAAGRAKTAATAVSRHPMLAVRSTNTPEAVVYNAELSYNEHWILNEHCLLDGDALFPGTGYIEWARAAISERLSAGPMEFTRLLFAAPFRVARGKSRSVELRLKRVGEAYDFAVVPAGSPTVPFASGSVRSRFPVAAKAIDLPALLSRCNVRTLSFGPDAQNTRQGKHISFGPRWRCLREVRLGATEAVSCLELAEEFASDLATFRIHPALLDAATGSALFTIPEYERAEDLYVPLSYQRITVLSDLTRLCYCHIRWPHGNRLDKDAVTFDITIADEQGRIIADVEEFTMRRLSSTALLTGETAAPETPSDNSISSAAGARAFRSILDGTPTAQILAVPPGWRLEEVLPAVEPSKPSASQPEPMNGSPRDEIEQTLAKWWQELLGIGEVSIHQDFFELGGHSLVAVRLFTKIKNHFGVDLDLATLFEARTIEALADTIHKVEDRKPVPSIRASEASSPKPGLFLIDGPGRPVEGFRELMRHFNPGQPVHEIQPPSSAKVRLRMEEVAADCVRQVRILQPKGPYCLLGHSSGGIVAFEMAQQLHAAGEKVGFVGLLNTWHPAYARKVVPARSGRPARAKRWKEYLRERLPWFQKSGSFDTQILSMPQSPAGVRDLNELATGDYKPRVYPGRVTLFRPKQDTANVFPYEMGWRGLANDGIEVRDLPGTTDDLFAVTTLDVLIREIEDCIDRLATVADSTPARQHR
jgi:acyl transferase domain-containing protein/thioesterase domain-containing protein